MSDLSSPITPAVPETTMASLLLAPCPMQSEQPRAEDDLAGLRIEADQQRRLYETILSNTPDLVYSFDLQHRFTYANRALLEGVINFEERRYGRAGRA